jgi:hypothetical protein
MARIFSCRRRTWGALLVLAVVLGSITQTAFGVEITESGKKSARKKGHRLPPHYAKVVKPEQREQIYKIQEKYQPKLEALKAQLESIIQQRDSEITAVLTPEQQQKIEDAGGKVQKKQPVAAEKASQAKPIDQKSK